MWPRAAIVAARTAGRMFTVTKLEEDPVGCRMRTKQALKNQQYSQYSQYNMLDQSRATLADLYE